MIWGNRGNLIECRVCRDDRVSEGWVLRPGTILFPTTKLLVRLWELYRWLILYIAGSDRNGDTYGGLCDKLTLLCLRQHVKNNQRLRPNQSSSPKLNISTSSIILRPILPFAFEFPPTSSAASLFEPLSPWFCSSLQIESSHFTITNPHLESIDSLDRCLNDGYRFLLGYITNEQLIVPQLCQYSPRHCDFS